MTVILGTEASDRAVASETTEGKQRRPQLFKPGESGNPAGRPKGSRNKLGEAFIADLHEDWSENGKAALVACREQNPAAYVKVVASLLPKDVNINVTAIDELSDDELAAAIAATRAAVELSRKAGSSGREKAERKPPGALPPVH